MSWFVLNSLLLSFLSQNFVHLVTLLQAALGLFSAFLPKCGCPWKLLDVFEYFPDFPPGFGAGPVCFLRIEFQKENSLSMSPFLSLLMILADPSVEYKCWLPSHSLLLSHSWLPNCSGYWRLLFNHSYQVTLTLAQVCFTFFGHWVVQWQFE